jgi:hypothetical protein
VVRVGGGRVVARMGRDRAACQGSAGGRAVRAGRGRGVAKASGGWAEIVCARGHLSSLSENGGTRPHVGVKSPRFVSL